MRTTHASPHATPSLALLADRDRDSRDMYAEYLRYAAYDVEEAEDGRVALAKALSRRPQIIITETQLPGIDGFELCELLRSDESTRAIPIILVTADVYPADLARAERAGADLVLAKPCLPDRLIAEVRRCLAASAELRQRASAARARAHEQFRKSARQIERSHAIRDRVSLIKAFTRHTTTTPPAAPPTLRCPLCDAPLVYENSQIGGVNERQQEQWDYYECPGKCGTFQYRERVRKLRRIR